MTQRLLPVLAILSALAFFVAADLIPGNLNNPEAVARELMSPPDSPQDWAINEKQPFSERILFKFIVQGTYHLVTSSPDAGLFYTVYKLWNGVFFISTVLTFYFFLQLIGLSRYTSFAGCLLLLISPPFIAAWSPPVHTREDMLGYLLLLFGMIATIKQKPLLVLFFSLVGFLCRETLLILPLFYFIWSPGEKWWIRWGVPALSMGAYIAYRLSRGIGNYDPTEGLRWNLANPAQVVGFLFLAFGLVWLLYAGMWLYRKELSVQQSTAFSRLFRSSPLALIVIVTTTFAAGIFNEIRLLFLAFPWLIACALPFLEKVFVTLPRIARTPWVVIYWLATSAIVVALGIYIVPNLHHFITPSRYQINYNVWLVLTLFHGLLTLAVLPVFIVRTRQVSGSSAP